MFEIPNEVQERINELNELCNKYPRNIPIIDAAKYIGIDKDILRTMLIRGTCPFGVGWEDLNKERMSGKIPTLTFWAWCTNGKGVTR